MKTFYAGILLIALLASCKKEQHSTITCEKTMTGIAGTYKLTKLETVSTSNGQAQDYTYTLTACELSGVYDLRSNGTASYTEMIGCTGSGSGTWAYNGTLFATSIPAFSNCNRINMTLVESWDCTHLALMTTYPGPAFQNRYTLTRISM